MATVIDSEIILSGSNDEVRIFYKASQIVMVDFGPNPRNIVEPGITTGPLAVHPEMFKIRHCIVLASSISGTTTIVPLSTDEPRKIRNFHYKFDAGSYPSLSTEKDSWLKGNLIANVSNERINKPLVAGGYTEIFLSADDFVKIQGAVLHGLELGRLVDAL